MKIKLFVSVIVIQILSSCFTTIPKELDNTFYCQNTMGSFENNPETPKQKAELMKTIGFDGLEGSGYKDFFELKKALDKEGIGMPVNYVGLHFKADGNLEGNSFNEIKEMIRSSDKGMIIYFYIMNKSFLEDKESGDKIVVPVLRELADYSAPFDVKLCVYPHINLYCETSVHSVKLAELVDRENYGAVMNLCHLLKVEGTEGLDDKIKAFAPWLFAVNINGADDGDTKNHEWDRLIQPLGQGSFDTYGFVKTLKDNGYDGPFGVQCYGLKGDVVKTLTQIMETWEGYKKRYAEEK